MNYYLYLALTLFFYMNIWFILSLVKKRNDVADIAWGLGFVLIAWVAFFLSENNSLMGILVNILVSLWGLRLAWHINTRNNNKNEDYRYQTWRREWGKLFYIRSYLQVYLLQGLFLFLISLPIILINASNNGLSISLLELVGLLVWILGFYFETVGDWQLRSFVKNPANKGKILQSGLWAYTRHPNYFGEVVLWWGIFIISIGATPFFYTIVGPLTITILILFVSGIPLLERKYAGNPAFEKYKKRTSVFFPLPPRN